MYAASASNLPYTHNDDDEIEKKLVENAIQKIVQNELKKQVQQAEQEELLKKEVAKEQSNIE